MKNFNLELRVQTTGSVLAWVVYLESIGNSSKVKNWTFDIEKKCYVKMLPDYSINDDLLDVFIACEGKVGAKTTCTLIINNVPQNKKTVSNTTDKNYAHETYTI